MLVARDVIKEKAWILWVKKRRRKSVYTREIERENYKKIVTGFGKLSSLIASELRIFSVNLFGIWFSGSFQEFFIQRCFFKFKSVLSEYLKITVKLVFI